MYATQDNNSNDKITICVNGERNIEVSEETLKYTKLLYSAFEFSGFQDRVIPLSQTQIPGIVITGEDVQYIFDYCEELRNSNVISHDVETIDGLLCLALFEHSKATMIELKEDVPRLNRLMLLANFLNCRSFVEICAKTQAELIRELSVDDIRLKHGIKVKKFTVKKH